MLAQDEAETERRAGEQGSRGAEARGAECWCSSGRARRVVNVWRLRNSGDMGRGRVEQVRVGGVAAFPLSSVSLFYVFLYFYFGFSILHFRGKSLTKVVFAPSPAQTRRRVPAAIQAIGVCPLESVSEAGAEWPVLIALQLSIPFPATPKSKLYFCAAHRLFHRSHEDSATLASLKY